VYVGSGSCNWLLSNPFVDMLIPYTSVSVSINYLVCLKVDKRIEVALMNEVHNRVSSFLELWSSTSTHEQTRDQQCLYLPIAGSREIVCMTLDPSPVHLGHFFFSKCAFSKKTHSLVAGIFNHVSYDFSACKYFRNFQKFSSIEKKFL